jgi:hypothetical protein
MADDPELPLEPDPLAAASPLTKPLRKRYFSTLIRRYEKRTLAPGTLAYAQDQYLNRMIHRGAATCAAISAAAGPTKLLNLDLSGKSNTFLIGSAGSVPKGTIIGVSAVIATAFTSTEPTIKLSIGVNPSLDNVWKSPDLATLAALPVGAVVTGGAVLPIPVPAAAQLRGTVIPTAAVYGTGALSITLYYRV